MKKKAFTNGLIAITFILGVILSFFGIYYKTQLASKPSEEIDWTLPIYENSISIEWPDVSEDQLAYSIQGNDGSLNMDEFESIFIDDFSSQLTILDIDDYVFDFEQDDDMIYISSYVDKQIVDGYVIDNNSKEYEYQYIVNE